MGLKTNLEWRYLAEKFLSNTVNNYLAGKEEEMDDDSLRVVSVLLYRYGSLPERP